METIGELLAIANALLFGLSNIFNKRALAQMDRDTGMMVTLIVNIAINALGVTWLCLSGNWVPLQANAILWFVLAGAVTSFFGRLLLFESVRLNGPSRAGSYKVASPLFTIFIGLIILGEQVTPGAMIGAVICLGGIWIISLRNMAGENEQASRGLIRGSWGFRSRGVLIGLACGLAFAAGMATRKVGLQIWPSAWAGAMIGSLTAFNLMLLSFYMQKKPIPWRQMLTRRASNYVYSGLCTGLAIICFFFALQYITVTIANVIAGLEPLFTVGLAYLMLQTQERITTSLVAGAGLVSVGVILIFIF